MIVHMKPQGLKIVTDTEEQLIKCIEKSNSFEFSKLIVDSEARTITVSSIPYLLYRYLYELSCDFDIDLI